MDKDPLQTTFSDGLAKMLEAAELIPEEKINELAQKARQSARNALAERQKTGKKERKTVVKGD